MQILTDPKYESVAYAIKADYMTYDDVKNNVINGLKNHNIITKGNYNNEAELRNMITSGKIKNMVTDSIIRQTKAKARNHSRMQAANPQAPNHQPANPGQQGPGIHH